MDKLLPEFFRRLDESPDRRFYQHPRFVPHIDEAACAAAKTLYDELLPSGGKVLDLMASFDSHLPDKFSSVVGLGLNQAELEHNGCLSEWVIHDLNAEVSLPFAAQRFDGVVCTVSVQYMAHPVDTFGEVARVLKPGAPFVVTFSNRMFPTKCVLAWRATDDHARMRLVESYFAQLGCFGERSQRYFVPESGDPLYALWAYKKAP